MKHVPCDDRIKGPIGELGGENRGVDEPDGRVDLMGLEGGHQFGVHETEWAGNPIGDPFQQDTVGSSEFADRVRTGGCGGKPLGEELDDGVTYLAAFIRVVNNLVFKLSTHEVDLLGWGIGAHGTRDSATKHSAKSEKPLISQRLF